MASIAPRGRGKAGRLLCYEQIGRQSRLLVGLGALAGCNPLALRLRLKNALRFKPRTNCTTDLFTRQNSVPVVDPLQSFKEIVVESKAGDLPLWRHEH